MTSYTFVNSSFFLIFGKKCYMINNSKWHIIINSLLKHKRYQLNTFKKLLVIELFLLKLIDRNSFFFLTIATIKNEECFWRYLYFLTFLLIKVTQTNTLKHTHSLKYISRLISKKSQIFCSPFLSISDFFPLCVKPPSEQK